MTLTHHSQPVGPGAMVAAAFIGLGSIILMTVAWLGVLTLLTACGVL